MTTYNTGNPVPSTDVRDLYDNAQNLDDFSNGQLDFYADRLGVSRQSLQGIRNASQYQILGPYAAGLEFTSYNQVFSYLGEFYAPSAGLTLPYTTDGSGAPEIANFRPVGDAILRQDLAAAGGYLLVSGGDFSSATAELALFAGVTRTIAEMAGDVIRLDTFPGITPNNAAIDNGPAVNAVLAVAAANKIPVDGYGATFYTLTPILPKSGQILKNAHFVSQGSPDGAGVPKSHISVIHIDGVTALKTGMYFENVTANGSRELWPNVAFGVVGPEGGGGEDGGLHAWRVAGEVTDSEWVRCKGVNAATAGWAIHNPLPSTVAVDYQKTNLVFVDCDGTGNREHGMFADSFDGIKWIRGNLTGNGLDLNGTDPEEHGNRGARNVFGDNALFGTGFDFEAYGPNFLGSLFTNALVQSVDCRGNAMMCAVASPIASDMAGFAVARDIRIIDCDLDSGLASGVDRSAGLDNVALYVQGNPVTVAPFANMEISSRMEGRPQYNGVSKLNHSGGFIQVVSPKAIVNNSDNYDLSCASTSYGLQVFPQPTPSIVQVGGTVGAVTTPTLQSTAAAGQGAISLRYDLSVTGALAAGGTYIATINTVAGYVISLVSCDVTTPGGVPIRSAPVINGAGGTASLFVDTSNDTSIVGTLTITLAPGL